MLNQCWPTVDPMLAQWWLTVYDAGPTLPRHSVTVSCLRRASLTYWVVRFYGDRMHCKQAGCFWPRGGHHSPLFRITGPLYMIHPRSVSGMGEFVTRSMARLWYWGKPWPGSEPSTIRSIDGIRVGHIQTCSMLGAGYTLCHSEERSIFQHQHL